MRSGLGVPSETRTGVAGAAAAAGPAGWLGALITAHRKGKGEGEEQSSWDRQCWPQSEGRDVQPLTGGERPIPTAIRPSLCPPFASPR